MIRTILVPLDGSALAEQIIAVVAPCAGIGSDVILLRVLEERPQGTRRAGGAGEAGPQWSGSNPGAAEVYISERREEERGLEARAVFADQELEGLIDEVEEYLLSVSRPFEEEEAAVRTEVRFGDAAQAIIELARQEEVDLIAMTTHGRTGLSRALHGSVAGQVLGESGRPVLLYRPEDDAS